MDKTNRFAVESMLSARAYNAVMGLCVLWGLVLDVAICVFAAQPLITWIVSNPSAFLILIIGFFVAAIVTTLVIHRTQNPAVSFVAYTVLSAAIGILVATAVPLYTAQSITEAFMLTTAVTAVMVVGGLLFPSLFLKMGRALFFGLLVTLVLEFIFFLVNPYNYLANLAFNLIFVVIFALYIAFDFARSQQYGKTLNNAIMCAADLYVDVVNLFLRLLQISGRR